ncbi:MAG: outer membrane protein [Thermoanaerobaculia bacterium]|jgi:TolC family type I secretion outer membrane protein|nr:outer membrane protein [Thermoanaerobaculia bacterium]
MLDKTLITLSVLFLASGCTSLRDLAAITDPAAHGVGTPTTPSAQWTPPATAIPPSVARPGDLVLPPTTAALELAQIVDIALSNNPLTRTTWLDARIAEANLGSARAAYLPTVDLGASLTRSRSTTGTVTSLTGPALSLDYLLFDFGGRNAATEAARQTLIAADYAHNQAIQDVILRVEQSYYDYLAAKALLTAQAATIKERQTSLDSADARHRAGVATIADVLQARTALSQAQLTYETIDGNLHRLQGTIATVMGLPATTPFAVGELPSDVPAQQVSEAVESLIARASAGRPDLAAARAAVERARARVTLVRAQGLPSLGLGASVAPVFTNGLRQHTTPYSAGISFRFPLFTGFRNTYDVRAAKLETDLAAENARGLEEQIGLQVWTSYYDLQTAMQRLKTSRDLLRDAQESVDVALGRYRAGIGNILDLLTAEAALENARAEEVQARTDWFLSLAQLAHDTGTLTTAAAAEGK